MSLSYDSYTDVLLNLPAVPTVSIQLVNVRLIGFMFQTITCVDVTLSRNMMEVTQTVAT